MKDPWTGTTVWGLTVGPRGGMDGGGQRRKIWENHNRITIKKKRKEIQMAKMKREKKKPTSVFSVPKI